MCFFELIAFVTHYLLVLETHIKMRQQKRNPNPLHKGEQARHPRSFSLDSDA